MNNPEAVAQILKNHVQVAQMVVAWRMGKMTAQVCLEQISYILVQEPVDSNSEGL